ncbi:hypothetical protein IWQ49_006051 [Labrenzia sp. EL_126]|nr:hypothetical protein [Labrenzia sp. EL_126]
MKSNTIQLEEIAFKSGFFAAQQAGDQASGWTSDDAWKEFQVAQEKVACGEFVSESTPKN